MTGDSTLRSLNYPSDESDHAWLFPPLHCFQDSDIKWRIVGATQLTGVKDDRSLQLKVEHFEH